MRLTLQLRLYFDAKTDRQPSNKCVIMYGKS